MKIAWSKTIDDFRPHFSGTQIYGVIAAVALVGGAVFLAFRDMSKFGFFGAFAGGLVAIAYYMIASFGSLVSIAFFTGVTLALARLTAPVRPRRHYTETGEVEFHWRFVLYGIVITLVWLTPIHLIVSHIPVTGYQIDRMLGDD